MIALFVVVLATPPGALVKLPSPSDLVAADRSRDEVELERVAARIGAVRLEQWAEHGKLQERLAALHALPLVDGAWAVLPDVAPLLSDGDGEVATAAANAARRIAESLTPYVKERDEVPSDVPARAATELIAQAQKTSLAAPLRIAALEAAAALRAVGRVDDKAIAALLSDGDATVRRAAAEALAGAADGQKPLEDALAKDAAAPVASAAGAALCRDVPLTPPTAKRASPAEDRAGKLSAAARQRLRTLALDESVPLVDRIDLVGCLRVGKKDADQKVLDELARRPPEALRQRARALGGR